MGLFLEFDGAGAVSLCSLGQCLLGCCLELVAPPAAAAAAAAAVVAEAVGAGQLHCYDRFADYLTTWSSFVI